MDDDPRTQIEVAIAAPAATVWNALRDRSELKRWFGWEYDGLEREIESIFFENATANNGAQILAPWGDDRIELEAKGGKTIVSVTRGPADVSDGWDPLYEGWITFMQQLRWALEHHPGEDRRTVYVNAEAAGRDAPRPREALGLHALPDDGRYAATAATGDELAGEVQFKSQNQLGLSVDGWGEGLLIVAENQRGGGSAVLTTYGMSDDELRALRERWESFWAERYR